MAELTPGAWVRVTTRAGKVHEGTVSIYDPSSNTLVISLEDGTVLVNTNLATWEAKAPKQPTNLPSVVVNLEALVQKERAACALREKEAAKVGVGVSPEGQMMFDALDKTLPCRWENTTIVVMNDVYVSAPYTPQDCKGPSPRLARVQKMVEGTRARGTVGSPKQSP